MYAAAELHLFNLEKRKINKQRHAPDYYKWAPRLKAIAQEEKEKPTKVRLI